MWLPLVDVAAEMGSLDFVSATASVRRASRDRPGRDREAKAARRPLRHDVPRRRVFYAGWTLHRTLANGGDRAREVMTITYFADGARVAECDRVRRAQDLKSWLPGQRPGELAGTHLNPVVYRRRQFDPAD